MACFNLTPDFRTRRIFRMPICGARPAVGLHPVVEVSKPSTVIAITAWLRPSHLDFP